jgi:hypothetical protein
MSEAARPESHRACFAPQDRRIAIRLALCFLLFYALFQQGHFQGTDEVSVYETTRSLYELGSLAVAPHQGAYKGRDGRHYSIFAVGQSLLALPFYGIGAGLRDVLPESVAHALAGPKMRVATTTWGGTVEIFTTILYAPFASALLVALFYLFERRLDVSRRNALAATLLVGTCTYVAMMSIYFLQHTTEAIAILGALLAFLHWKETGSLRALAWGSALASSIVLIRVPASVAGLGLAIYLLHTLAVRWREPGFSPAGSALAIAAPAAGVFAVHATVNYAKWGMFVLSPMLGQYTLMDNPLWVGLYGFLFSSGSSVFPYTPLLLMAPLFLWSFARRWRWEAISAVAICLTFLLFCSKYELWTGLYSCPGPRYQFIWTPLLLLALGPWLDARPALAARLAVAWLAVTGFAVQLVLLTASWPTVIAKGGYLEYQPKKGFLYVASDGPIPQSALRLLDGDLGNWLYALAKGWDGEPAHPIAALSIIATLLVALVFGIRALRNTLREAAGS